MRLNSFFIAVIIFFQFLSPQASSAAGKESYLDTEKKRLVQSVQDNLYSDHFQTALQYCDSLIERYPNDPIGLVVKAGVFVSEMTDAEEKIYDEKFHALIDSSLILVESNLMNADSSKAAWMFLWQGHARAYTSLFESRFGSFTSALSNGFKAKSAYQEGLAYDSSLYDLYGGLGMYHYWKSAKAGILRWIRVFNNDKEKGIDELYLTVDSSEISKTAAQSALVWIYIDKKEYDSSLTIARELYAGYPDGKTFLWPIAEAEFQKKEYELAIASYRELKEKLKKEPGNFYNMIEVDYRIYESYKELKKDEELSAAASAVREYVNIIPQETKNRQRGKINTLLKVGSKK